MYLMYVLMHVSIVERCSTRYPAHTKHLMHSAAGGKILGTAKDQQFIPKHEL